MTRDELEARLAGIHRFDEKGDHEMAHRAEDLLVVDVLTDVAFGRAGAQGRAAVLVAHLRAPHRPPRWMA